MIQGRKNSGGKRLTAARHCDEPQYLRANRRGPNRPSGDHMRITRRSMLRAGAAALLVLGGLAVGVGRAQAATNPWMDATQPPSQRADELLAAMTQAEKLTMMHGGASCGYVGCVDGNSRLGIPALHLQDGPVGAG